MDDYAIGDHWLATHAPIRNVIQFAFDLDWAQLRLSGAPGWTASEKYDIDATGAQGARRAALQGMVRAMLVSRFGLKYHWETSPLPSYSLTVSKGGAKLSAHTGDCPQARPPTPQQPSTGANLCGVVYAPFVGPVPSGYGWGGRRDVHARGITIAELAHWAEEAMRPVAPIDNLTGLQGEYDLHFQLNEGTDLQSHMANLARALASNLGLDLSLHAAQHPMPVLVIDQIHRPTPN